MGPEVEVEGGRSVWIVYGWMGFLRGEESGVGTGNTLLWSVRVGRQNPRRTHEPRQSPLLSPDEDELRWKSEYWGYVKTRSQ